MNREIKFRAYHKEQKRMFEVYGLGIDFITENTLDGVNPGTNAFCGDDMNFIVIMQFTEMKDKNGFEIFEGDFLKDSGMLYSVEFGEFGCDEWTFKGWILRHVDKRVSKFGFSQLDADMSEVIGNIYQNPEFIK